MFYSHYRMLTVLLYCFGLFSVQNDTRVELTSEIIDQGVFFNSKNEKHFECSEVSLSQQDQTRGLSETETNTSFKDNGSDIKDLDSDYALLVQSDFANLHGANLPEKFKDTESIKKSRNPVNFLKSLSVKLLKHKKHSSNYSASEPF